MKYYTTVIIHLFSTE